MANCSYSGQHTSKVDAKGRTAVPAKFRKNLGEKFYITKGTDGCLFVYDEEEWDVFSTKLSQLTGKANITANRHFVAFKEDLVPDAQGRVRIPESLRRCAGITDLAMFAGVGTHIEVWAPEKWDEFMSSAADVSECYEDIAF